MMKSYPCGRIVGWVLSGLVASAVTLRVADVVVAAEADPAAAADGAVLAWIRFDDAEERYKDVPYLWLGRFDVQLTLDVEIKPGDRLELLWGSKNDDREGVILLNAESAARETSAVRLRHGGYDGFRWLTVPLPDGFASDKGRVMTLSQGSGRAGFIAAARLVAEHRAGRDTAADPKQPAHKMKVKTPRPSLPEAFPHMRAIWDARPSRDSAGGPHAGTFAKAEGNARQANESLYRCRKFVDGWLAQADPKTGLIPRNLNRDRDIWNAQDSAADNYPFMVLTAAVTDRPLFDGRMLDMLRTETRLTSRVDRLPDTWSFSKQAFKEADVKLDRIIFGGSEYVKDGLIPLTEWLGPSPWAQRMIGIVDDIFKHASVETPFGKIPSTNVEVNGELLQALSRIYWMTGDEKYLAWAIRLGDYYLLGDHHPTLDFDTLRLRDHGCEIVSGLSELYAAVSVADPAKKKAYQEPVHAMFDRVLEVGRNPHGMLYNHVNPKTGEHHAGICDTWGYNYNGIYTVYLIDKTEGYRKAVRHVLSNLEAHYTEHDWGSADEFADSIEGAINLYSRERVDGAAAWIDSEIRDMWSKQRPDGVLEGWHGDGNSARTAIMYTLWKTQGLTIRPWREDVRFGAVEEKGTLYVSLTADEPWSGRLLFDKPRHRVNMHLPLDYPRINQFPEWYTAETSKRYGIEGLGSGTDKTFSGAQLQQGILLELGPGKGRRLTVRRVGG